MDATFLALAAKYVRRHAKQLADQLDGVCTAEDIEFVHRARVASRRLRAALRLFRDCFGRKQVRRWRKQIRRITSQLGDARDKDVQIEYLCDALARAADQACYPGMARVLVHAERQREALQKGVVKAVERLRRSEVIEEMQAASKPILAGAAKTSSSAEALARAEPHIQGRLEELLLYQASLGQPTHVKQQHAMRIAAKRLRYTLEIVKPLYPGRLEPIIEAVKEVQTQLGEIHDCDVWVEQFETFAEAERKSIAERLGVPGPFARLKFGIDYLCQDRREHRAETLERLVAYWEDLERQGTWQNLLRIAAGQDAEPTPAADSSSAGAGQGVTSERSDKGVVPPTEAVASKGPAEAGSFGYEEPSRPRAEEFLPPARPPQASPRPRKALSR